jgi:CopA family copper-resistance protein
MSLADFPLFPADLRRFTRRRFVQGLAAGAVVGTFGPAIARAADGRARPGLSGNRFDLTIEPTAVNITGRPALATLINGLLPGPLLRWREGDLLTLRVTNRLRAPTSIHWHGIIVPTAMDGVPGLSFPGIAPGETFVYRFPVRQSGTFWYHSHTGFQLQTGAAGALVIEPREPDPVLADRDHVVMLTDWSDEDPEAIFRHLKAGGGYYNYHRRTVADFFRDASHHGLGPTVRDRLAWARMRMDPRDLQDVSGAQTGGTYTYLVNGQPPAANWTALFKPGERVRLRFINGSSMSYFDVRIPGLKMTVVAADGSNVEPVPVDEFRIAVAETYDVIVVPREDAYTIFAQAMDRSGYARATLAVRAGLAAPVPPLDPIYDRTMLDMGMADMAGMAGMAGMHDMPDMPGMPGMPGMSMPAGPRRAPANATGQIAYPQPQDVHLQPGPAVVHIAAHPTERLDQAGGGLDGNGRRVLTYAELTRRADGPQNGDFVTRAPDAEVLLHLTGNMERFIFGFNGLTYEQSEPVRFPYGQRIEVTLVNDTMMEHPIHLHGLFTELDNHRGRLRPLKHTISIKPGEELHYFVNATEAGRWAYHCHLLYHMCAGMFTSAVIA